MDELLLTFNGVNHDRGGYLFPQMSGRDVLGVGSGADADYLERLCELWAGKQDHFGMVFGFDPKKLEQTGWGVIFAAEEDAGVYEALKPLLDLRREQAGERYREYRKENGYVTGKSARKFLWEKKAATSGPVDPRKMPYYLLIVGSPANIPFSFQYDLDVQYGVGRIHFDSVADYAQYAAGVVAAEAGKTNRAKKAVLFGTANPDDAPTQASAKYLVEPLRQALLDSNGAWEIETVLPEQATKSKLTKVLGGEETAALLFAATHGIGGGKDWKQQKAEQGALVCQEWPGPRSTESTRPFYFAAEDLVDGANVGGAVAMFFACYGGGTPKFNEFVELDKALKRKAQPGVEPVVEAEISDAPFIAALPKRMLSHPKGGALAVIAHVERALSCSFQNTGQGDSVHIGTFESAVKKLMDGYPVGFAMEEFNSRHAELGNTISQSLNELKVAKAPSIAMVQLVSEYYDTRNYSVIGDPAVCLAVEAKS